MNLYIMVDLEGISGIFSREQLNEPQSGILMAEDINACVNAAKEAGVEKIYVRDCHGASDSVSYGHLSENADYYICGRVGEDRYPGLDDCDAVIFLGYHAMAGTAGGVLEHTFNSKRVQNYWLNGVKTGEARFDALGVGERGKPVIMIAGDDKLCAEVRETLPGTVTCEVKKGVTWNSAMLLPKEKAHARIAECTKEAIRRFKDIQPYTIEKPYTLRIELVERGDLPFIAGNSRKKIIDGRTYEVTADKISDLLILRL